MTTIGRFCEIVFNNRSLALPLIQSVRYRKPRWLPIAKSKEFYVREPTPIDPDEYGELKVRYAHYRSAMKSIRYYLRKELIKSKKHETALQEADASTEFAWMEQQTQDWNQKIAAIREERLNEERKADEIRLQNLMSQREQRRLQEALEAERRLHDLKTVSKDLITEDNLDQEIEKMLDSRSDYNYALTRDGRILEGEHPNSGNSRQTSS